MRGPIAIVLVALCVGCGRLPWSEAGLACQRPAWEGGVERQGDPRAAGEPMAGIDIGGMSAAEIGAAAIERGLPGVTWRYTYPIGEPIDGAAQVYSECWCVAPPDGRVSDIGYDSGGGLIVFVDAGRALPAQRAQPREGWGCPEAVG